MDGCARALPDRDLVPVLLRAGYPETLAFHIGQLHLRDHRHDRRIHRIRLLRQSLWPIQQRVYGSIGTIIVMIWFYFNALVLILRIR